MVTGARQATPAERIRELVAGVRDPELPMLTIGDLGVLRGVRLRSAPAGATGGRSPGPGERNEAAAGPRALGDEAGQGAAVTPPPGSGAPTPGGEVGGALGLDGGACETRGSERPVSRVPGAVGGAGGAVGPEDDGGGASGGESAAPGPKGGARGGLGVVVSLTPTYSGCPALDVMRWDVRRRLADAGFGDVEIRTVLDPPWSSDWITPEGRRKLAEAGIAPPGPATRRAGGPVPVTLSRRPPDVACPRCGSRDTVEMSAFGSTACKSLRRCRACTEPFEHVKEI